MLSNSNFKKISYYVRPLIESKSNKLNDDLFVYGVSEYIIGESYNSWNNNDGYESDF